MDRAAMDLCHDPARDRLICAAEALAAEDDALLAGITDISLRSSVQSSGRAERSPFGPGPPDTARVAKCGCAVGPA